MLDLEQSIEICNDDSCTRYAGEFGGAPVLRTAFLKGADGRQYFVSYQPESGLLSFAVPLYQGSFAILVGECKLPK